MMLDRFSIFSSSSEIKEVHLTDQSASGFGEIYPPLVLKPSLFRDIVVHKVNPSHPNHSSIHHGSSINFLIHNVDFSTSHVILTDSDCFPVNSLWSDNLQFLLQTYDAVCALEDNSSFLTHPCFMVIPAEMINKLDFLKHTQEYWIDTGRLVGLQLIELGYKVYFLQPKKVFPFASSSRYYLDQSFVHIGSSSFRGIKLTNDLTFGLLSDAKFAISRNIAEKRFSVFNREYISRSVSYFPICAFYFLRGLASNLFFSFLRMPAFSIQKIRRLLR
jgi:hypothetical protein